MSEHLSTPIRRRIVILLRDKNKSYAQVADALGIGTASVNRVWRHFRQTGEYQKPLRQGGIKAAIGPHEHENFAQMIRDNPSATYDELAIGWYKRTKSRVSRSAIMRLAHRLGFTRKKKTSQASQKTSKKQRSRQAKFRFLRKSIPVEKLIFLDESGFQARLSRPMALSRCGTRANVFEPALPGKNITVTGAVRLSGPIVMRGKPRAATRRSFLSFLSFLRCDLLPRLKPRDVLVMDNLSAHKGNSVRRLCKAWDIRLLYLPPYCPEYNPIEKVWSWMKARLRGRLNRAVQDFRYVVSGAWRKAASLSMKNLFLAAGYSTSPQAI